MGVAATGTVAAGAADAAGKGVDGSTYRSRSLIVASSPGVKVPDSVNEGEAVNVGDPLKRLESVKVPVSA
jgi:biotin carboxyl carrier protein